jgi:UDP-N-acetyl-D-glucosamine dehydrogenase
MKIMVAGMGKIGLPLAVSFALRNNQVVGLDIQDEVVAQINSGVEPFPGEPNLERFLNEVIDSNAFRATTNAPEAISNAEVLVVCIPLLVDQQGNPDFANIDSLVAEIGKYLRIGSLVCFETTLPVGTTKDRFSVILAKHSNLAVGKDFNVVFSPERVLTGRIFEDLRKYPKLVGGVTQECTKRGASFYRSMIDFDIREDLARPNGVWEMENSAAAEFAKIAETTYRDVNIGLANEFAVYAKKNNVDVYEVISAANSQPYSHIHTPGISVGGHCIPVYPKFYLWQNPEAQIVEAARDRNLAMPSRAITQIKEDIGSLNGLKIGVLGVTYRPGVKEAAHSGAITLLQLLKSEGAIVFGHDPFFSDQEILAFGFDGAGDLVEMDGLILHTSHTEYKFYDYGEFKNLRFFFDGRNAFPKLSSQVHFNYLSV